MKEKGLQKKVLQLKKLKVVRLEKPNLVNGGNKLPIGETEYGCATPWWP